MCDAGQSCKLLVDQGQRLEPRNRSDPEAPKYPPHVTLLCTFQASLEQKCNDIARNNSCFVSMLLHSCQNGTDLQRTLHYQSTKHVDYDLAEINSRMPLLP